MRISKHYDISMGHRLHRHPGKCSRLHGHNYRITLYAEGEVDNDGMVFDFSLFDEYFDWVKRWDHRTLLYVDDPLVQPLIELTNRYTSIGSVVVVPFIPTAENIAQHVLDRFPNLSAVKVQETRRCVAFAERGQ